MDIYQVIALALVIGVFYWFYKTIRNAFKAGGKASSSGSMVCPLCGTRGEPATVTQGSTAMELLLWICFIVPGLIYSLWRLTTRKQACPTCHRHGMIPVDTPKGRELIGKITTQA